MWLTYLLGSNSGPWIDFAKIFAFDICLVATSVIALRLSRSTLCIVVGTAPQVSHLFWSAVLGIAFFCLEPGVQGISAYVWAFIAPESLGSRWHFWAPVTIGNYAIGPMVFAFLVACVVTPAAEEFIFRGLVLAPVISSEKFIPTALVSSLAFSLMHFKKPELISVFCFSLGMAAMYRISKSLWSCIIAHSISNFLTYVQYHYLPHWFERTQRQADKLGTWALELALLLLSIVLILTWLRSAGGRN